MPYILLTGGDKVEVSLEKAQNIELLKFGKGGDPKNRIAPKDPKTRIKLEGYATFELKEVRRVVFAGQGDNSRLYAEQTEKNNEILSKVAAGRERLKKMDPVEKALNMIKTYCFLCYVTKGNREPDGTVGRVGEVMFRDPLHSKLLSRLVDFFEKNPDECYAPASVYQNVIPQGRAPRPAQVEGWKSAAPSV